MKKRKMILRPIGAALDDYYTRAELFEACEQELFTSSRCMDTKLTLEILQTLDERPDEVVAPHQDAIWAAIQQSIRPIERIQMPRRKMALVIALVILLLASVGGCLAWAIKAGVISFPSMALDRLPQVVDPAADTLVQKDLFYTQYEHCELRVLEAAYDGHQIRIVYSLRDTRPDPTTLTEEYLYMWQAIPAAQLDGIACCDYLTVDGQVVFLNDTYQLLGGQEGEMLYYLAANIPEDVGTQESITIQIPMGKFDMQAQEYMHSVEFVLDTKAALNSALYAVHDDITWGNTKVSLQQAAFSPVHGTITVTTHPIDPEQPYDSFKPCLYTLSGQPFQQEWYHEYGLTQDQSGQVWTIYYIPTAQWPDQLLLAEAQQDGSVDRQRCLTLELKGDLFQ